MKDNKKLRFRTTELRTYRKSNYAKDVYFERLDDSLDFARNMKMKHPQSNKINGCVYDTVEFKTYRIRL